MSGRQLSNRTFIAVGALLVLMGWAWLAPTGRMAAGQAGSGEIWVEIKGRLGQRIRIAVPDFVPGSRRAVTTVGRYVADVISYDLDFSGYFEVMDRLQYPPDFTVFDPNPRRIDFGRWSEVRARDLVHGVYGVRGDQIELECRLFDVQGGRQIIGKGYKGESKILRRMAHRFADEVVLAHTGRLGIAHTHMAFTSTSTGTKEIFICDYDGENVRQLTNHGSITLSPTWSPDATKLAYTSYAAGNPDMYVINADGSSPTMVAGYHGLNTAPDWSPTGDTIAVTLSKDGNSEIYLQEAAGKRIRRVTYDEAIDTSPSFSPDGTSIAFVTDRAGSPQIWVVDIDGRNLRRISYQGGRSFSPAWSPRGDKIAYVVELPGEGLQLFVMDADGRNPVQLTSGPGWNQEPSWSPNGTHIAFSSTRAGRSNVYTMRSDGSDVRRISFLGGENGAPAWSR
jgi:TolB protein